MQCNAVQWARQAEQTGGTALEGQGWPAHPMDSSEGCHGGKAWREFDNFTQHTGAALGRLWEVPSNGNCPPHFSLPLRNQQKNRPSQAFPRNSHSAAEVQIFTPPPAGSCHLAMQCNLLPQTFVRVLILAASESKPEGLFH